jgi:hypothetical protein
VTDLIAQKVWELILLVRFARHSLPPAGPCETAFLHRLEHLTDGGKFVAHLNEQFREVIELLWEQHQGNLAVERAKTVLRPPKCGCLER